MRHLSAQHKNSTRWLSLQLCDNVIVKYNAVFLRTKIMERKLLKFQELQLNTNKKDLIFKNDNYN